MCTACHKMNDIHKFCVYCGNKLLDDDKIRLILDNPKPYCINCGRIVNKGQAKCECGYEFRIMDCPKCNTKNAYANRFCTTCGEKLWTSNVCEINYGKIRFPLFGDGFPHELRNTIMHFRYKQGSLNFPGDSHKIAGDVKQLQSDKSMIDNHLNEIISRWKIVSPDYCINCLSIMKPEEYRCKKCGTVLPNAEKRIEHVKNKKYSKPVFDRVELKWNSKFSENYLDSLAPAIGESQFEYRERLKWEFAENINLKSWIINKIKLENYHREQEEKRRRQAEEFQKREEERKRQAEERKKQEEEYIRQYGGGYCSSSCGHHYTEMLTEHGISSDYTDDFIDEEDYCDLGHTVNHGRFCVDYE